MDVQVQSEDFDVAQLQAEVAAGNPDVGAIASFVGTVRGGNEGRDVAEMTLEHYPGMTERSIQTIIDEARGRWPLLGVRVVHRVGVLKPGDQIVYVGVASSHRQAAFEGCEFIMDYLKTRAPFWKKEVGPGGAHWVDARNSDTAAADRWRASLK